MYVSDVLATTVRHGQRSCETPDWGEAKGSPNGESEPSSSMQQREVRPAAPHIRRIEMMSHSNRLVASHSNSRRCAGPLNHLAPASRQTCLALPPACAGLTNQPMNYTEQ